MGHTHSATDLLTLFDDSDTDAECRNYLVELRWPKGATCTRCAAASVSRLKARRAFECNRCRHQFSVTSGTVFHDSHLPLSKWLLATFILCESTTGVSTRRLMHLLGVSYKTAWSLSHRIRAAILENRAERPVAEETGATGTPRHSRAPHPYVFRDVMLRLLDAKTPSRAARKMSFRQGELGATGPGSLHE